MIYSCKNGAGSTPEFKERCPSNMCTAEIGDDVCIEDPCACKDDKAACGSSWPAACNYKEDTIYKCDDGEGTTPDEDTNCKRAGGCTVVDGVAQCKVDCTCPDETAACGSTFPELCGLDKDTVYQCSDGKGTEPKRGNKCAAGECMVAGGDDGCIPTLFTDCKCTGDKAICGSNFNDDCNLDKDRLYTCRGAGADPDPGELCATGDCVTNPAGIADKCKDPCACKDDKTICFSSLDDDCKKMFPADTPVETVLACSGGAKPTIKENCKENQICDQPVDQPAVCKDVCKCTGTDTKCSSEFSPACKLPDGVYNCGADGKPEKVEDCTAPDTCKQHTDGPKCTPEECICKDALKHCGVTFDAKCNLPANTLHSCTAGDVPKEEKDCNPGVCSSNNTPATDTKVTAPATGSDDFCIDQCACKVANEDVSFDTFHFLASPLNAIMDFN
jgi:hypothetical protein